MVLISSPLNIQYFNQNEEQTKNQCDLLDERIKQLNVTEDVGVLNISILEVATRRMSLPNLKKPG